MCFKASLITYLVWLCVLLGCYWFPWTCWKSWTPWPCCEFLIIFSAICLCYIGTAISDFYVTITLYVVSRELLEPLDPEDLLAKMEQGELVVRLALLAALVRLVLLDPQDLVARKDLLVLMEPL